METFIKMSELELRYHLIKFKMGRTEWFNEINDKCELFDTHILSRMCDKSVICNNLTDYINAVLMFRKKTPQTHHKSLKQRATNTVSTQIKSLEMSLNDIPHAIMEDILSCLENKHIYTQLLEKKLSISYYCNERIAKIASRISFGTLIGSSNFIELNIIHGHFILNNQPILPSNIFEFAELIYYYKLSNQLIISESNKKIIENCRGFEHFGYKPKYFDLIDKHGMIDDDFEYNPDNLLRIFILLIQDGMIIGDRLKKLLLK